MWNRRQFLLGSAALGLPSISMSSTRTSTHNKFILILLRGGLDGLAAIPPHGDPDYERARRTLSLSRSELIDLDGFFGLHPALEPLLPFWQRDEFMVVHAAASPYRSRSHFDAQKILENGSAQIHDDDSGWLNRTLEAVPTAPHAPVAIGRGVPLVLRGPQTVSAIDPIRKRKQGASFMDEVQHLYTEHPSLHEALTQHLISQGLLNKTMMSQPNPDDNRMLLGTNRMGALMNAPDGPNIAVLELNGFDTHIRQGTTGGALANRLTSLGLALNGLAQALGDSWSNTVVAVATEFGRTVAPNGSGGTDHGTGSAVLLLGGAIRGGRILTDWPGLRSTDLYDGRDLRPTIDTRAIFGGLLHDHLNVPRAVLTRTVFPNAPAPLDALLR